MRHVTEENNLCNLKFYSTPCAVATYILCLIILCISIVPASAYAAVVGEDICQGDTLRLKAGDWQEDYIVLDPTKTNAKTEGIFLLKKDYGTEKTEFNYWDYDDDTYVSRASFWDNSTAQAWCTQYYRNLPDVVRNAVVGVRTTETESGYHWAEINNIDGTTSDKDKVFFLSYKEYDNHRDVIPIEGKMLLRTPGSDCTPDMKIYVSVIELVDGVGTIRNYGAQSPLPARPAFNLDIPADVCATKTVNGNETIWTCDFDHLNHSLGNPTYLWTADYSMCTAFAECETCGAQIEEVAESVPEVTLAPTSSSNGVRTHTASFVNPAFTTQSRQSTIPAGTNPDSTDPGDSGQGGGEQDPSYEGSISEVAVGDSLMMGAKNASGFTGLPQWRVLDKDAGGNLLLLSEYLWRGDGQNALDFIKFIDVDRTSTASKSPVWQGSNAQGWCKAFESAVLGNVAGLTIVETTKSDYEFNSPDSGEIVFAASENILNKDKVFFLSAEEAVAYMPNKADRVGYLHDGVSVGESDGWWLRSPRLFNPSECAGKVLGEGSMKGNIERGYVYNLGAMRPALWAKFAPTTSVSKCVHDGQSVWLIDYDNVPGGYSAPTYTWSSDNATCTAQHVCNKCGYKISETAQSTSKVTTQPTATEEGVLTYSASFTNPSFKSQVKLARIARKPASDDQPQGGGSQGGAQQGGSLQGGPQGGGQQGGSSQGGSSKTPGTQTDTGKVVTPGGNTNKDGQSGTTQKPSTKPATKAKGLAKGKIAIAGTGATRAKYIATSATTVAYRAVASKNTKSITVPSTIKINGKTYKVTKISDKAFNGSKATSIAVGSYVPVIYAKTFYGAKYVKKISLGKGVKKISAKAFTTNKALRTIVLKTAKLTSKSSIKNCLLGSKVTKLQVKVSTSAQNKKYIKKYKQLFAVKKAASGKKVKVV